MHDHEIENFLGVFPNAVSHEYCDTLINFFEKSSSLNKVLDRQNHEAANKLEKDTHQLYFEPSNDSELDDYISAQSNVLVLPFTEAFWKSYELYSKKYGIVSNLTKHILSLNGLRIQKTSPSEAYHVWHCEHDSAVRGNRVLLAILYLNDVEEGGETEFLYQSKRIKAQKGTMIICPSGFTHAHRGNPPLSGNKYIANTWAIFTQ
jgi:hypothetical protein